MERGRTGDAEVDGRRHRRLREDVSRDHDDGNTALCDRGAHGDRQHARNLFRGRNHFAEVRAGEENLFWASLLKVVGSNFSAGNLRGDGENRNTTPVTVVQTVDEVQISRAATSRAHGELSADLRLTTRGEGRHFFMAHHLPVDAIMRANRVGKAVEGVAGYAIDAFDARF